MQLDIDDEEILDKRSIANQNLDFDRTKLVGLNSLWKRKFSAAKKQQVLVSIIWL